MPSVLGTSVLAQAAGAVTDFFERLAGPDGTMWLEAFKKFLRKENPWVAVSEKAGNAFTLLINYSNSIVELVKSGNYDAKNSDVNDKNFQVVGEGTKEIEARLIHFNRIISSDEAIREMEKQGLRPANVKELLSFGATYPEEQRKYPIVALGSVWQSPRGVRSVPYLWGGAGERRLRLSWFEDDWREIFRFLAVSKPA